MKRNVCCIIIIVLLHAGLYAQDYLFLGVGGGIFSNMPADINTRALAVTVHSDYHKYMYTQYDYLGTVAPIASVLFGYSTKHFGVQLGFDALFNINENIEALNPNKNNELTARISYTYSSFNIPLILQFFPVSKPKFKFGFLAGAYLSIPYDDVQKDATAPEKFFTKTGTSVKLQTTSTAIGQDFSGGVRFGLLTEFSTGKGAFVFEIGYQRELYPVASSMNLEAILNDGVATVEYTERKITILSGPRISIAYKHKIKSWSTEPAPLQENDLSQPPPQTALPANTDTPEASRYFMMVAGNYEGPLPLAELKTLVTRGLLTSETMLWKKGMTNWTNAGTFEELQPLFAPPR